MSAVDSLLGYRSIPDICLENVSSKPNRSAPHCMYSWHNQEHTRLPLKYPWKLFARIFSQFLVVAFFAQPSNGQNQIMKASIQGHVSDPQKLAVPGANVQVILNKEERSWPTVTDKSGFYVTYGLSPGRYRVEIDMPGFKKFTSEEIDIQIGETIILDVSIQLAELTEQVLVRPSRSQRRTDYSSPANFITEEQIAALNTPMVEDVFNYQPSITIRRRYIGDSNGTIGMRGANMFQTARSMVYADGVPLHNPLQTRWSGAPRWSLVAPDEVAAAEVIYGPFSAEYSGNAMGGVVKLKTALPTKRQIRVNGNVFSQPFALDGTEDTFNGARLFTSYGDHIGKFGFQVFYNFLGNTSQPQSWNQDEKTRGTFKRGSTEPQVTGAFRTTNEMNQPAITYGDTGAEEVASHLIKFKGGYELSSEWDTRLTLAFEQRNNDGDRKRNYLKNSSGQPIWGDGRNGTNDAQFNGEAFNVRNDNFGIDSRVRKTLFVGWELNGSLNNNWQIDTTVSRFNTLDDTAVDSNFNPLDPMDDGTGVITAYDKLGWTTVDLKLHNPVFLGNYDFSFITGYHLSVHQIGLNQFTSSDYRSESRGQGTNRSSGKTSIHGLFSQLGWRFHPDWELTMGARQEFWSMRDGYAKRGRTSVEYPERDISAFSPKLSLGWEPASRVRLQYSFGKAHRFPIPEELFDNQVRTYGTVLGDASLEPEDGIHHNLSLQYGIGDGHFEANFFRDNVDNTIFTQFQFVGGRPIFSFLPVDKVETNGVEMVLDQRRIFDSNLDLQVNGTIMKSTIQEHELKSSWVGNEFPRMPRLRIGMFAVYHFNSQWLFSLGARYSSNQFGDLGNADIVDNVFGSIDAYLFVDTKVSYRLPTGGSFSLGISNLTNAVAFVHHPWPQRTFFGEFALDIGSDLLKGGL